MFDLLHARTKKHQLGFSLIELMVVITIIGILAGVAVPRFSSFRARAFQTEAKSALNGVYLASQSYMAANNQFYVSPVTQLHNADGTPSVSGTAMGFALTGNVNANQRKYNYDYIGAANGFAAVGNSQIALANTRIDTWRINANGKLCSAYDAVVSHAATAVVANIDYCPQQGTGVYLAPVIVAAQDNTN